MEFLPVWSTYLIWSSLQKNIIHVVSFTLIDLNFCMDLLEVVLYLLIFNNEGLCLSNMVGLATMWDQISKFFSLSLNYFQICEHKYSGSMHSFFPLWWILIRILVWIQNCILVSIYFTRMISESFDKYYYCFLMNILFLF